jgi:hypothetical protein
MQLVCVDRRYQRMNCFNIRELQGILKRRFFTDLVNSADHREVLSSSMIGLRFRVNNNTNLDHDVLSFFKLGTNNLNKSRSTVYQNGYISTTNNYLSEAKGFSFPQTLGAYSTSNIFSLLTNLLSVNPLVSLSSMLFLNNYTNLFLIIRSNFSFNTFSSYSNASLSMLNETTSSQQQLFSSKNVNDFGSQISDYSEKDNFSRFSRFSNPIVSYDYKCGNYIGI